jgi:hypothetical protein
VALAAVIGIFFDALTKDWTSALRREILPGTAFYNNSKLDNGLKR